MLAFLNESHKKSVTLFDKLPTSAFELVLDLLNDEDIPPLHLVSKSIFVGYMSTLDTAEKILGENVKELQ